MKRARWHKHVCRRMTTYELSEDGQDRVALARVVNGPNRLWRYMVFLPDGKRVEGDVKGADSAMNSACHEVAGRLEESFCVTSHTGRLESTYGEEAATE